MTEVVLEYVAVGPDGADGNVLDRVTFDGDVDPTYETGSARQLVEQRVRLMGSLADALDTLRSWSNGYVLTKEAPEPAAVAAVAAAATGQQRDPTPDEAASGADFAAHQQVWQSTLDDLQQQWPDLAQPMVDDLSQQSGDDVADDRLADLATLAVSAAVVATLAAALAAAMAALAVTSAGHVVAEAAAQGKTITAPEEPGADRINQVASVTAGLIASGYASAAARKAMQLAGPGANATDVATAVAATLDDMSAASNGWVADNLRPALSAAQMAGRQAVFAAHPPKTLLASEINDSNTCEPCKKIDGSHFATLDEAMAAYPLHGYVGCLGGLRCRGQLLGLWT